MGMINPFLIDVCYPRKLFDDVKYGKKISFFDLTKTGMAIGFLVKSDNDFEYLQTEIQRWVDNMQGFTMVIDLDDCETQWERICDIWWNQGKIGFDNLSKIFFMICACSVLSKYKTETNCWCIGNWLKINTKESGYFYVLASHKDLNTDVKVMEYWETLRKLILNPSIKKKHGIFRTSLPKAIRHEVFKRDGFRCTECGASNKVRILHIDHIIPFSKGGTDELDNLRTLCNVCNLSKSNLIYGDKK